MATRYWQSGDGNWDTVGNWGGTKPVTGDTAIFPEGVSTSVSAGLDQGGVDLALLYTHPRFTGSIGSSGSPLKIAGDLILHESPGDLFVESDLNAGSAFKIDEVRIMSVNPSAVIEIGSNAADVGDVVKIIALRGNVTVKANISLDAAARIECGHLGNMSGDLNLNMPNGVGTVANLLIWGGQIKCEDVVTALTQSGGTLIQDVAKITAAEVYAGTLQYDYRVVGGDSSVVRMHGGTLDLMQTADEKTITTLETHASSTLIYNSKLHTFTTWNNFGGTVLGK